MATRIDKTPGLSQSPQDAIIRSLRSKAGKREQGTEFIGLKRSNSLSDVLDPRKALNNILAKLNEGDTEEQEIYGSKYDSLDWAVIEDFALEGITKDSLLPLLGVSAQDGIVNLNPRIRIQDRISQIDSFAGIDSFNTLHAGPSAQFYRAARRREIGFLKFNFDETTGQITVNELKGVDGVTNITDGEILLGKQYVILNVEDYELEDGSNVNLSGTGIFLKVDGQDGWSVDEGISSLTSIKDILGSSRFVQRPFRLSRDYSSVNPPPWFSESPGTGIPDSVENIIKDSSGNPVVSRGYWYSKAVIESRWGVEVINRLENSVKESVIQDSNMRWESPPAPLRSEAGYWGIRWDGYLYITPGIYAFQVETNCLVKIDVFLDEWTNVFSINVPDPGITKYFSDFSFNVDNIDDKFKYFYSDTEWDAYMPITIRMYLGGPDKSDPSVVVPSEPNIFLKTTKLANPVSFYNELLDIELDEISPGEFTILSSDLIYILSIVQNEYASVKYELVEKNGQALGGPILIEITELGTISNPDLEEAEYKLKISPLLSEEFQENLEPLWKGRIASPKEGETSYAYLVSGNFNPNQQKIPFNLRKSWWKVSQGHPYERNLPLSPENTPFDGFASNIFKGELSSGVEGFGLYGDGDSNYTQRPNIIIGESRYNESAFKGSNYVGIQLSAGRFGEGGRFIVDAFPINNSVFDNPGLLGEDELGGDPYHKTSAFGKVDSQIARIYLWTTGPEELQGKYFLTVDSASVISDDDPQQYGLPDFSSDEWLSPISISAVQVCDNSDFIDSSVKKFPAVLPMVLEKEEVSGFTIISFSVFLTSLLPGGSEVSQFSGKFIRFYTSDNREFQNTLVDTGETICYSDVLKLTYDNNDNIISSQSEIPKTPSDRVTPFGFDGASGICYPPYVVSDPLLKDVAISDSDLYNSPGGWYDVFWGDYTKPRLGDKTLTLSIGIEFRGEDAVETVATPINIDPSFYSHKFKVDMPLEVGDYDEDILTYLGNGEQVSDTYYLFVNLSS
jgi:hypothetical protein